MSKNLIMPIICGFIFCACGQGTFSAPGGFGGKSSHDFESSSDGRSAPSTDADTSIDSIKRRKGSGGPEDYPKDDTEEASSTGNNSPNADPFNDGPSSGLPIDCGHQNVLIIDLKSGWWEGDGGETFTKVIVEEIRTHACPGAKIGVEYHHIIKGGEHKKFNNKNFSVYTQVWLLSGSLLDPYDLRLETPSFQNFLTDVAIHKPNLFLGAGFGSVDHANALAQHIWNADIFMSEAKTGDILEVEKGGKNVSIVSRISPLTNGNLFTGVSGQIVDMVRVGGMDAGSDGIIIREGVTPLANCKLGKAGGGTGDKDAPCVAIGEHNGIRFVLDSGLQRFYSLYSKTEANTKTYFRNVVRALSK